MSERLGRRMIPLGRLVQELDALCCAGNADNQEFFLKLDLDNVDTSARANPDLGTVNAQITLHNITGILREDCGQIRLGDPVPCNARVGAGYAHLCQKHAKSGYTSRPGEEPDLADFVGSAEAEEPLRTLHEAVVASRLDIPNVPGPSKD